jgi:hypothetical protein
VTEAAYRPIGFMIRVKSTAMWLVVVVVVVGWTAPSTSTGEEVGQSFW